MSLRNSTKLMPKPAEKTVIILGGGFGGLNAAKKLANRPGIHVLLLDRRNHHLFQPLLYQVATAGLSPSDIAVPIRAEFSDASNVEVHWSSAEKVDLQQRKVITKAQESNGFLDHELHYDYLILACGASHSYFDHPEWENFAPGLKTIEQATEIRRRILSAFERAENEFDASRQKTLLTFVIVGGGPTGIELAGAIADISRNVLQRDFKRIDPSKAEIILIEAGSRVLASFSEATSLQAKKDLEGLGVTLILSTRVENINADGLQAGDKFIYAKNVFWAAGVQATKLNFEPIVTTDRSGRIKVGPDLSIPDFPEAFAIGDMALVESKDGKIIPGLAPAAIQEGIHSAKMILRSLDSRPRIDFKYIDKGLMATIGKHRAVAQIGSMRFSGYAAWLAWFVIHILYLVGFKNRVAVILQWSWSYIFSKRGARLITDKDWKS